MLKGLEFSSLDQGNASDSALNKIDVLVLYILYRSDFKSGQAIDEVALIFHENFSEYKKEFLSILEE